MKRKYRLYILVLLLIFLVSCSGKKVPTQDTSTSETAVNPVKEVESGYPITQPEAEEDSGYPISENEPAYPQGPEFSFDTPVTTVDEFVTGTGPAGVPIKLIDVSEVGHVLSETLIDNEGLFKFILEEPLISGYTIGIQLGDLENTDLSESDFQSSDSYFESSLVGILFDMLVVE